MNDSAWKICPSCKQEDADELKNQYGKIPLEEFLALTKEAQAEDDYETEFLEDYKIGIFDGSNQLNISYSGRCQICDFQFHYNKLIDVFTGKEIEEKPDAIK